MVYVISVLVVVAAFALVAWPLFRPPRGQREGEEESSPWQDLLIQRHTAYEAIKDLDFEYQLGNLSEEDYRTLRGRYRRQAAEVLRRLDSILRGEEAKAPETAQPAPRAKKPAAGDRCPACSAQVQAEDRFCWRCGQALRQRCPKCGKPFGPEDRFCSRCGTSLRKRAEV